MIVQKCVRTYVESYMLYTHSYCWEENCNQLNEYLADGRKVVMVTRNVEFNEYIIEKYIDDKQDKIMDWSW